MQYETYSVLSIVIRLYNGVNKIGGLPSSRCVKTDMLWDLDIKFCLLLTHHSPTHPPQQLPGALKVLVRKKGILKKDGCSAKQWKGKLLSKGCLPKMPLCIIRIVTTSAVQLILRRLYHCAGQRHSKERSMWMDTPYFIWIWSIGLSE